MRIGLLSDTHGHLARSVQATQVLLQQSAEVLIHCGDIGSENVLIEMAALLHKPGIPGYAVLGNVDLHQPDIIHFPPEAGIDVRRHHTLTLAEKRLSVIHGDDGRLLQETIAAGEVDYLFTGHTHVADDREENGIRIINPGAVFRSASPSVAMLDTATGRLDRLGIA